MLKLFVTLTLLSALLYRFIIQPLFISPLCNIPTPHWSCHISPIWIQNRRRTGREIRAVHAAHASLGPIVRLGPNEISVNSVKGGLSKVYAGGWEKDGWYEFFSNYGVPPMFATTGSKPHATRKRMLSNIYSKSTIQASPSLRAATSAILHDRLLPLLASLTAEGKDSESSKPTSIYPLISGLTMDFVTAYIFGLASATNFTQDAAARARFLHWYKCRHGYAFWPQEHPKITAWLRKWLGVRLVPAFVDEANANIEKMTWGMCEKAAALLAQHGDGELASMKPEAVPAVYAQLSAALGKSAAQKKESGGSSDDGGEERVEIASEVLDHLAAGFDTSGITLTYLVHELSQRPALQAALRAELLTLPTPLTPASAPRLPGARELDALPMLHAVLMETLRLHAAIPGPQPRTTPVGGGASLGPPGYECSGLPAGVRVAAQAWSLHRNEDVFAEAEQWWPERWMDGKGGLLTAESSGEGEGCGGDGERYREMTRWFWAFGSGGRMCIGSHLAIYQMKFIVAAIYSNYETSIVSDDGIRQSDAYTAPPVSNEPLIVTFRRAR
ncbi:cytochrome P450 monooxygenase-like protein [Macrophomina phaseolina]|uniref:Cytochrome P450 monooxygenase-like protein n=1 Tax=Macrophomina phaseolina TaxID=35725 RepID=A0ABQ8G1Q5_9PEZI|nr:cytochrome P450 monooxygenase-like protein [Macrophomina phaseolina]